jgi:hypothetical protein
MTTQQSTNLLERLGRIILHTRARLQHFVKRLVQEPTEIVL